MPRKLTIKLLSAEVADLRERIEDFEDLRDLKQAIQKNGDRPLIPWAQVKKELKIG
jgi:hypothetical protein